MLTAGMKAAVKTPTYIMISGSSNLGGNEKVFIYLKISQLGE